MNSALLRASCPRCREGPIFRGIFAMNETCPICGLKLGREKGYFLGSMIVGYVLAVPIWGLLAYLLHLWLLPSWPLHWTLFPALVLFVPLVPFVFRYSRVAWIHLEWFVWHGS